MRRADRLFDIVQALRGRRLTTARYLAERLGVSERTIYRDIQDLSISGVPIQGEAGVGYQLAKNFDLPPIMFEQAEIEALLVGARMVSAWGGTRLAAGAERAMEKIAAILPASKRAALDTTQIFVPNFQIDKRLAATFDTLHEAVAAKRFAVFDYEDEAKRKSQRRVRPLALHFWGERWTLAAWCETRNDFRLFRLDRLKQLAIEENIFSHEAGKTLADFLRKVAGETDQSRGT
jgi:predicted DNA-binding transcriptional regulator YafY